MFRCTQALTDYASLTYLYLIALRSAPTAIDELAFKEHLDEYLIPLLRRRLVREVQQAPTVLAERNLTQKQKAADGWERRQSTIRAEEEAGIPSKCLTSSGPLFERKAWVPTAVFWTLFDRRQLVVGAAGGGDGNKRNVFAKAWITRVVIPAAAAAAPVAASIISDNSNVPDYMSRARVAPEAKPTVVYFRSDELAICDNIPARWVGMRAPVSTQGSTGFSPFAQTPTACDQDLTNGELPGTVPPTVGQTIQVMIRVVDEEPMHADRAKPSLSQQLAPAPLALGEDPTDADWAQYSRTAKALEEEVEVHHDEQSVTHRGLRLSVFAMPSGACLDDADVAVLVPLPVGHSKQVVSIFREREKIQALESGPNHSAL
jgi:hypothetical protein